MKFNTMFFYSMVLVAGTILRGAAMPVNKKFLAKDFFKEVVGMNEDEFRKNYGWNEQEGYLEGLSHLQSLQDFDDWLFAWKFENPSRNSVPNRDSYSIDSVGKLEKIKPQQPLGLHKFNVVLYDPSNPLESEITALQANPQNKNAAFQVASTFFGPLEGGMYSYDAKITDMLKHPVQGEWASVGAAGATIYRKYMMPTVNFLRRRENPGVVRDPSYYYLLHGLRNKAPMVVKNGKAQVSRDAVANYNFQLGDSKKVDIFTQRADVTSKSTGQGFKAQTVLQKIAPGTQSVFQIFNSAYNMNYKGAHANPNVQNFAKMILRAMYHGTIRKAYALGARTVYLTLLGGGAFRNDISWISQALNDPDLIDFIKKAGLTVNVLYRPDKTRMHAVRTPAVDKVFLQNMFEVADAINGTQLAHDPQMINLLNSYVDMSYAKNGAQAAWYAQKIQEYVETGGKGGSEVEEKQAAELFQDQLTYSKIKGHNKPYNLAWLYSPVHNEHVLISWKDGFEPVLNKDGTKNFRYVSPNAPSIALPAGLYYWKNMVQPAGLELSNRQRPVFVRGAPQGKNFVYSRQYQDYVNAFRPDRVWNSSRSHQSIL